ncbi:MAG: AAA family ATPase [Candidatus Aquicultor sp.]|nr:AAA family ATPase [Candidatus Aquicultor sp.]
MSILIEQVRVFNFRGLQNIHVELGATTVLTGMNNTGKTSFLKAMQIALGNSQFITQDDFNVKDNNSAPKIIIDIKIVPVDKDGVHCADFDADWEVLFTEDRIMIDVESNSSIPLRTIVTYDPIAASYKTRQYILPEWPQFEDAKHKLWYEGSNGKERTFHFDEVPFYYMDAQRDILEDMKMRSSYFGKMISKIEYSEEDIKLIEDQIKELNEKAVNSSSILVNIKATLKELDSAMDTKSEGVEITPFTKKIRDLNKGINISYSDNKESFPMEYHGMGTRSWSSLLTLKAFINLRDKGAIKEQTPFFPILAIEEPEAHLHPNAQKKLYNQIDSIEGQKIISTHSPYIASSAQLRQLRNIYKNDESVCCGAINTKLLTPEDIRKIERHVVNTRGELFFSKVIIFFEGETEEQALPIFAEHFFKVSHVEAGIDFVGVGGCGNYLPFLRVAESLKIPWFIFSDAEANVKTSVRSQFTDCKSAEQEVDIIVFLSDGNNFEKQLVDDGYIDEIRVAIVKLEISKCSTPQHMKAKKKEIAAYDNAKIMSIIEGSKAQFGPLIAEAIIESNKPLPPKIVALFEKLEAILISRSANE